MKKLIFLLLFIALIGYVHADCLSCGNLTIFYDATDNITSVFVYDGESEGFDSQYYVNSTLGILGTGYMFGYADDNISYIPNITINTILNTSDYCSVYEMPFYWEAAVSIINLSNEYVYQYDENILADCTTTTTTTSTSTTEETTTTTTEETTTTEGSTTTTTSGATTTTSGGTTTTVGGSIPTYTTIGGSPYPTLNGSSIPAGGLGNHSGLGTTVLGLGNTDFFQYLAYLIILTILVGIGSISLRLGVITAAMVTDFFVLVPPTWLSVTLDVLLIVNFLAVITFFIPTRK